MFQSIKWNFILLMKAREIKIEKFINFLCLFSRNPIYPTTTTTGTIFIKYSLYILNEHWKSMDRYFCIAAADKTIYLCNRRTIVLWLMISASPALINSIGLFDERSKPSILLHFICFSTAQCECVNFQYPCNCNPSTVRIDGEIWTKRRIEWFGFCLLVQK